MKGSLVEGDFFWSNGDEQFFGYRGDSLHSHSSGREILEDETLKSDCMKRGS